MSGMRMNDSEMTMRWNNKAMARQFRRNWPQWTLASCIAYTCACGLRLDDEVVRVTVGIRLVCQFHQCFCGATVDRRARLHVFSCKYNSGKGQRHRFIKDLFSAQWSEPVSLQLRNLLVSQGQSASVHMAWHRSQAPRAAWDVTGHDPTDTIAAS
jgi:hypothetical protein